MSTPGVRIKQARHREKLSQRALAERTSVSANAISKYERGLMKPGSGVLMELAEALGVDVAFFLRPARVETIEPAYRKLSKLGARDERQVIERIRDWLERYLEAESIVLPEPAAFDMPEGFPRQVSSMGEAEMAARALREAWDLGIGPIEDLTALLEGHGIRVGVVDADDGFDACTFRTEINGRVPVVVTRCGLPGDRQRFNLAHELGHLVLSFEAGAEDEEPVDEEKACHRFAGALLAPGHAVIEAVGGPGERCSITLDELQVLKHRFGISMQALVFRLRDLGIVSDHAAAETHRAFRTKGWHRKEPGDPVEPEAPERFHLLVLRALAEELISERRARELYGGPVAELESTLHRVA